MNLYQAFQSLKNQDEFDDFMTDLCSPAEIRELNARWKVAQMLWTSANEKMAGLGQPRARKPGAPRSKTGLTQKEISDIANVSISLTNRVARCLFENTDDGYRTVLTRKPSTHKS